MYSPNSNQRMGRIVVGLGPDVAKPIAAAMAAMEEADQQRIEARQRTETEGSSELDTSTDSEQAGSTRRTSVERDHELEQEEKLIQAYKLINQLETSNAKAASELEALRTETNSLQSAFDSFKNEVETEGRRKAELASVKQLQIKADRDRDYISELETELENMRISMQGQERQIERFKAADGEKQKLRDDVQLLRAERDELLQKNRANENLKKKIHTLQDVERTAASLREELKEAQEQLTQMDRLKEQVAALQKANAENMTTIANEEQEIFDQKTAKKRLEHEFKMLAGKWEVARERQGRDHETIRELEDRIRMLEEGRGSDDEGPGGLEDEMEKSERSKEARRNKSMDLSQSADYSLLQQNLDSLRARNSKLEQEYLDLLQDKLGLETAVEDLRSPDREPEENVPFLEQRKKLQATESELAELRNTCFSITAALSKAQERLAATEGVADLEGNAQYQDLVARYDELHKHSEGLEAGLNEQRSLLRHALLAQASLVKEPEAVRESNEYKIVLQQLEAVRAAEEESDVLANTATSLTDKIEAGRKSSVEAEKVRLTDSATASFDPCPANFFPFTARSRPLDHNRRPQSAARDGSASAHPGGQRRPRRAGEYVARECAHDERVVRPLEPCAEQYCHDWQEEGESEELDW